MQLAHGGNSALVVDCSALEGGLNEQHLDFVHRSGADGVHILANEQHYQMVRTALGENAIVGADCKMSRHDAMVLGEIGAQYIAVSSHRRANETDRKQELEMIRWWTEIFTPPLLAWDPETLETAGEQAQSGADFIAIGAPVWDHQHGPVAAMESLQQTFCRPRQAE